MTLALSDLSGLSQLCLKRELMLALQWMNLHPQAGDLQSFFTDTLYGKIAELSCVPSTEVHPLPALPPSQLWDSIKTASAFMMQLLAMKIRCVYNMSVSISFFESLPGFFFLCACAQLLYLQFVYMGVTTMRHWRQLPPRYIYVNCIIHTPLWSKVGVLCPR